MTTDPNKSLTPAALSELTKVMSINSFKQGWPTLASENF